MVAKIWEPLNIEVYKDWLATIEDEASDKLSSWETDFIESIGLWLRSGRQLTQKQAEILERIYADKTS